MTTCRQRPGAAVLWLAAVLAGCGGGGDGTAIDASLQRDPLPTIVQDVLPDGPRLDLRDRLYFPGQAGDSWTYDVVRDGITTAAGATLQVTGVSDDVATLTETVLGESSSGRWRRTAEGVVSVAPLADVAPPAAAQLVGDLLEYPEPFYAVNAERLIIRQGTWGADLDGDGQPESFRLEISQVLLGFEPVALPNGSAEAVHFRTVTRLTVTPSLLANAPATAVATEHTWWAPGLGRVRAETEAVDGNGSVIDARTTLQIVAATLGGVQQFQALPGGALPALAGTAITADRRRGL